MKLRISREELQKRSLFLATPVYGGQPWGVFSASVDNLKIVMEREGLRYSGMQTYGESCVARARNYLAHQFLKTDMTHMLFIDADIDSEPADAFSLLVAADPASDKDVVCGAYPRKQIAWKKLRDAAKAGFGDEDASDLENFVGDYFFKVVDPEAPRAMDEPVEVWETGTGFMMIQRHVFERFMEAYPEREYFDDTDQGRMWCFFDNEIYKKRFLTEDYSFCRLIRDIGMKIWLMPEINLGHMGFFKYQGNIGALAAAAARQGEK